jgi:hypothetical protein
MANYVQKLRELIEGQVEKFIAKVMKDEYTVDNGLAPIGQADGTGRIGQLMNVFSPRYTSPSEDDAGTSKLFLQRGDDDKGIQTNNNPLFPRNLIHRLNTPFDHIDRILLQDLSETMGLDGESE